MRYNSQSPQIQDQIEVQTLSYIAMLTVHTDLHLIIIKQNSSPIHLLDLIPPNRRMIDPPPHITLPQPPPPVRGRGLSGEAIAGGAGSPLPSEGRGVGGVRFPGSAGSPFSPMGERGPGGEVCSRPQRHGTSSVHADSVLVPSQGGASSNGNQLPHGPQRTSSCVGVSFGTVRRCHFDKIRLVGQIRSTETIRP